MYNPATQVQVLMGANLGSYYLKKTCCGGFPHHIPFKKRLKHYISGDSINEDVDIIQVVTPEVFIGKQIQETAESVSN